ncbi:MAG: hypothetical protein HQL51_06145 [Magnetococcales bacterium]|nr:hypothetical protein [Magnetococcales bacterium]
MTAHLFYRLAPESDSACCLREMEGPLRAATLDEAASARLVVPVPGLEVLLLKTQAPKMSRRQMEKAIPFLVEDQLAAPLSELHCAVRRDKEQGGAAVGVAAKRRMEQWLAQLAELSVQPAAMPPEPLLLPWVPGTWTVALEPHQALVRLGPWEGFGCDPENLEFLLARALTERPAPQRIRALDWTGTLEPAPRWSGVTVPVEASPQSEPLLHLMATEYQRDHALDLLQGDYGVREQWIESWWKPFRLPLLLLTAWLILRLGWDVMELRRLESLVERREAQVVALFKESFPEVQKVVSAQSQMRSRLDNLRQRAKKGGAGFLELLSAVGGVFKGTPNLTLLHLNQQENDLDVQFLVDNLEALSQLKEQLQKIPGLEVEIRSAATQKDNVLCHIKLGRKHHAG